MTNLHSLHLQDLQNPRHPSSYEEHKDYTVLVLRLPERIGVKHKLKSYGFVITTEGEVWRYHKSQNEMVKLSGGLLEMYRFLDSKCDVLMRDIDSMSEKIMALEEHLYGKLPAMFMHQWHDFKKELSRAQRVLHRAVDVSDRFIDKSRAKPTFPAGEFNDLYEHLERTLRFAASANDQLDNLYHFYTLRSSDMLNRSIYILTVVSVIFLPLNLVVGFFGMNTGGLPFASHPMGTMYAFESMVIFALVITFAVLWRIKKG